MASSFPRGMMMRTTIMSVLALLMSLLASAMTAVPADELPDSGRCACPAAVPPPEGRTTEKQQQQQQQQQQQLCGTDGKTYANRCLFDCAVAEVRTAGRNEKGLLDLAHAGPCTPATASLLSRSPRSDSASCEVRRALCQHSCVGCEARFSCQQGSAWDQASCSCSCSGVGPSISSIPSIPSFPSIRSGPFDPSGPFGPLIGAAPASQSLSAPLLLMLLQVSLAAWWMF